MSTSRLRVYISKNINFVKQRSRLQFFRCTFRPQRGDDGIYKGLLYDKSSKSLFRAQQAALFSFWKGFSRVVQPLSSI